MCGIHVYTHVSCVLRLHVHMCVSYMRTCRQCEYMFDVHVFSRNKLRVRRFVSCKSPACVSAANRLEKLNISCIHVYASIHMCMYTIKRNTMLILLCAKVHTILFPLFVSVFILFHPLSYSLSLECTRDKRGRVSPFFQGLASRLLRLVIYRVYV